MLLISAKIDFELNIAVDNDKTNFEVFLLINTTQRGYLVHVLGISSGNLGDILQYLEQVLGMSWAYLGHNLGISGE